MASFRQFCYNVEYKKTSKQECINEIVPIGVPFKKQKANFKFDIVEKKLELYPMNGKFDFIISSIAKNCGHYEFKEHYKCSFYKPLISSTLIN